MSQQLNAAQNFEMLVSRVLAASGFDVQSNQRPRADQGFDFEATLAGHAYLVEVKYYRTARAQVSLIETAASQLIAACVRHKGARGMLVVSCAIPPEIRVVLEEKYGLAIADRTDLAIWVAKTPELVDELNAALEDRYAHPGGRSLEDTLPVAEKPLAESLSSEDKKGTDLCEELRALKRGKGTWSAYETLCERILKYLFFTHLSGWHRQKCTDDGLSRVDYICRIKPGSEFWDFLISHLDSRYILFEFKNYRAAIKQEQILTTEKYLLEKGLRRTAIVFCRTGAAKSAMKMAQGAMREHGKLILVMDDNRVCQMLHMKERGEDPADLLFEVADEFLLGLPR